MIQDLRHAIRNLVRALSFGAAAVLTLAVGIAVNTIALLLTGVALAACYVPARRASKLEPLAALRTE